jgi:long-chain fatty acid transport protein
MEEEFMRFVLKHAALAAACMAAFPAYATNGYFLPGFGIRSQGMGGVGIAYGRDSLSTAANPANAVNTGMRGDMGFAVFNPERSARVYDNPATPFSPGFFNANLESDSKYFIVPEMGFTMPLDDKLHVGMAVVGNGGMNTNYPGNVFPGFDGSAAKDSRFGVDMMQLLVPISAAYKVNENHALGASLVLAETRFRAYGFDTFNDFHISADEAHLTGNGFDYSYGAGVKLGWLGEFMDDKLTVGLTYASRTWMTKFDKYRGLFAEQGGFDIPESYGIGIAFKPAKNLVIAADVLRINYADIASIGNRGPGMSSDPAGGIPAFDEGGCLTGSDPNCLGRDEGMGFGWQDMTVYKLGVQYGVNNRLQVRAGFNYGETPVPDDQLAFNTAAPGIVEKHYSVGFTYKANENLEVSGTYMYAASNNQSGCGQNIVDCAQIGMHQNVFGLTMGWVLDPGPVALEEYGESEWGGINFDGWYAGLNFGQSKYNDIDADSANTRTEGWKVYGGHQFNKHLGVEGGYANLNDMTARTGAVTTNVDTDAWTLAAVVSYPVTDKFSVMGKLGAAYMLADEKRSDSLKWTGDDGYEPNYGVGVSYALLDNVSLRAEWERFDRADLDIDLLTAGVAMKF